MTPALELDGAGVWHGTVPVLAGVRLRVMPGECVALLGRNGAGKSSLLGALAGLEPRLTGGMALFGTAVAGWPAHRRARLGLALVPQGRGLFPGLTVRENLLVAPGRAGTAWTAERVFDRFPALAAKRDVAGGALSGGERQVMLIARALLGGPRLLLLDEPSEGLAPRLAEEVVLGILPELAAEGMAVVLAEQAVGLALRLCRRAVVLAENGVVFDGAASGVAGTVAARWLGV